MKRQLSILACLVLVVAFVFSLASCDVVNKVLGKDTETECTEHTYVDGKCECGATDPNYVPPHVHNFVEGACECGATDPNYVPPHVHNFVEGKCECGASDPNYVAPADGTAANPYALTVPGTLDVNFAGGMNPIWYVFTAAESKTLSITLSSNNACMAYGVKINDVVYTETNQTNVKVNLTAGTTYYVGFCSQDGEAAQYTVTAEYVVSPYERVLHAGNNTVVFSAAEVDADAASRKLVIDEEANYKFASGNLFVSSVVDANGNAIAKNDDYTYTLAAGEYTVNFSMLSMFGVAADANCTLNVENPNADIGDDDEDDEDDDTVESDFVIGENTVTLTDEEATIGKEFTFVAYADGTYTFSGLNVNITNALGMNLGRGEAYLNAGVYTLIVGNIDEVGGEFTLTISYTAPTVEDGDEGEEGSEENPTEITLPAENLAANGDSINFTWYTFTTTEAGQITLTFSNANSWARIENVDDAEDSNTGYQKTVITFKVKANSTYKLGLGVWDAEEGVTVNVDFELVDPNALADKGFMYADDEANFDVTDADIAAGGFTVTLYAMQAGEYFIYSNDLLVESVVKIDDGTAVSKNDYGYFELEAYTQYTVTFSTAWVSNAGTYSAAAEYQYPEGHVNKPIWIYGLGGETVATYKGDFEAVWFTFYANANGVVTITTADTAASIMFMPVGGEVVTNDGTTSVSLTVMQGRQYLIGVIDANWSTEARDITFTATLTEGDYVGDGSMNTPNVAVDGSNTANVPAWDNTYFVYTATANGVLTLTSDNELCSWTVTTEFGNWEFVDGTLTIALEMDQKAYIAVSTDDFSAAEIVFNASFKADPTNSWYEDEVIADGSAANEVAIAENTYVTLSFWGMGQFQITWDNDDAVVMLVDFFNGNTVLANGDVITGGNWGTELMVYLNGYAAGTVNVTITPYVAESSSNSLVIGDNTIEVQDTSMGDTYALPVNADETVTYVLTVGANGVLILSDGTVLTSEGSTTEITVPAGETVTVGIGALSWSDNVAVISVAVKEETAAPEGGEEGNAPTAGEPVASVTIAAPGNFKASGWQDFYTVAASGNYVITAENYDSIQKTYIQIKVNGGDSITVAKGAELENQMPYTIALNAGDVVTIQLYGWSDADKGTEVTVILTPAA